jgi:hypothetical protein
MLKTGERRDIPGKLRRNPSINFAMGPHQPISETKSRRAGRNTRSDSAAWLALRQQAGR